MSIPLPLSVGEIIEYTDIHFEKDDKGKRRNITSDEWEWFSYLIKKSGELFEKCVNLYNGILRIRDEFYKYNKSDEYEELLSSLQEQMACAVLLATRCREIVKDEDIANVEYSLEQKSTRIAELEAENDKLRKRVAELENAPLQGGEGPRLRTMWRYVLELEGEGKPDDVIREALRGDGFSYATADALLYDGTGRDSEAVKKWGQRKSKKGDI